jgi:hypothetical protein
MARRAASPGTRPVADRTDGEQRLPTHEATPSSPEKQYRLGARRRRADARTHPHARRRHRLVLPGTKPHSPHSRSPRISDPCRGAAHRDRAAGKFLSRVGRPGARTAVPISRGNGDGGGTVRTTRVFAAGGMREHGDVVERGTRGRETPARGRERSRDLGGRLRDRRHPRAYWSAPQLRCGARARPRGGCLLGRRLQRLRWSEARLRRAERLTLWGGCQEGGAG